MELPRWTTKILGQFSPGARQMDHRSISCPLSPRIMISERPKRYHFVSTTKPYALLKALIPLKREELKLRQVGIMTSWNILTGSGVMVGRRWSWSCAITLRMRLESVPWRASDLGFDSGLCDLYARLFVLFKFLLESLQNRCPKLQMQNVKICPWNTFYKLG